MESRKFGFQHNFWEQLVESSSRCACSNLGPWLQDAYVVGEPPQEGCSSYELFSEVFPSVSRGRSTIDIQSMLQLLPLLLDQSTILCTFASIIPASSHVKVQIPRRHGLQIQLQRAGLPLLLAIPSHQIWAQQHAVSGHPRSTP